jgi:hypothetical protein
MPAISLLKLWTDHTAARDTCRSRRKKESSRAEDVKMQIGRIVDGVLRWKAGKDRYGLDESEHEGPDSYRDVVQTRWNFIGTIIFLYYCAASILYFIYRAKYTLDMGILWCAACYISSSEMR